MKSKSEDTMHQEKCDKLKPSVICNKNDCHNTYPHNKMLHDHSIHSFGSRDSECSEMTSSVAFDDLADFRQSFYDGITDPVNAVRRWLYDASVDESQCPERMYDEATASTGTSRSSHSKTNTKQADDDSSLISDLTSQYTLKRKMLSVSGEKSSKRFRPVLTNLQEKRNLSSRPKNFTACSLFSCSFGNNYVDDESFIGKLPKGSHTQRGVKEVSDLANDHNKCKNDLVLSFASEKMKEKASKNFPDIPDRKVSFEVEMVHSEDQIEMKDSTSSSEVSQDSVPLRIQVQQLTQENNPSNDSFKNEEERGRDNLGSELSPLHRKEEGDEERITLQENNMGPDTLILNHQVVVENQRQALKEIDSDSIGKRNNDTNILVESQDAGKENNVRSILRKVSRNKTNMLKRRIMKYPFSRKSSKQQRN